MGVLNFFLFQRKAAKKIRKKLQKEAVRAEAFVRIQPESTKTQAAAKENQSATNPAKCRRKTGEKQALLNRLTSS
jgi:hypothetical protein